MSATWCCCVAVPSSVSSERVLEEEVQRVRLKNIHLANALKKLESTIRNKEQLAGALEVPFFTAFLHFLWVPASTCTCFATPWQ